MSISFEFYLNSECYQPSPALRTSINMWPWWMLPSTMRPYLQPALTPVMRFSPEHLLGSSHQDAEWQEGWANTCPCAAGRQARLMQQHHGATVLPCSRSHHRLGSYTVGALEQNVSWALTAENELTDREESCIKILGKHPDSAQKALGTLVDSSLFNPHPNI